MFKWRPYTPRGCGGAACHAKALVFNVSQQFSLVLGFFLPTRCELSQATTQTMSPSIPTIVASPEPKKAGKGAECGEEAGPGRREGGGEGAQTGP